MNQLFEAYEVARHSPCHLSDVFSDGIQFWSVLPRSVNFCKHLDSPVQSETVSGLHYIAIGIGSTIATQAGGPLNDRIWAHLKTKSHGKVAPEYRVPLLVPGALLVPLGLLLYGWGAEKRLFWIVTDIGAAIFSGGVMTSLSSSVAYIIDEFGEHAASANVASRMLSSVMGFSFPLFAPQLYKHLGHSWGNSLLAFLYIAIGWPAPILLWKWGAKLRAVGRKN